MVRRRSTVRFRNGAPAQRGLRASFFMIQRLTKRLRGRGRRPGLVVSVMCLAEDLVHDGRAAANGGDDYVAVDGLGHVGGLVTDGVADLLERDAVGAHDRYRGVPAFVGMPVADACSLGHLAEPPVERVAGVHVPVLVAEHKIVVLPGSASSQPFGCLTFPVGLKRGDRAPGEDERALRLWRLNVAGTAR